MSYRRIVAAVALLAASAWVGAASAGPVMPPGHAAHAGHGHGSGGSGHHSGSIGSHSSRHGIGHGYRGHGYHGGAHRTHSYWPSYRYGYGGGYPYPPTLYPPCFDPYYVPPLYLPAETLYGPQAVKRFMGVDPGFAPRPNVNIIVAPNQGGAAAVPLQPVPAPEDDAVDRPLLPPANAAQPNRPPANRETLALAWKFIGYGDAHFGNQRYADANSRYRKATGVAPQLADAWFRQAFALSAMGRYELAAKAIRRGLQIKPDWADSDFRVQELYGGNALAKSAHLDALAQAAEENANDADLLFLVGVHLHFDGQQDRAGPFFQRARQLSGNDDAHLGGFLP